MYDFLEIKVKYLWLRSLKYLFNPQGKDRARTLRRKAKKKTHFSKLRNLLIYNEIRFLTQNLVFNKINVRKPFFLMCNITMSPPPSPSKQAFSHETHRIVPQLAMT